MEEQALYTTPTAPDVDALWQMHYTLSLNLEHLLYRQFRADLPETFKPDLNRPGADRFLARLALTRDERVDLERKSLPRRCKFLTWPGRYTARCLARCRSGS